MDQLLEKAQWTDVFYSSFDDLRLYGRHYRAVGTQGGARPLLCLSSFTGNSDEFIPLAAYLSTHPTAPRDVYCLDYRGRGRSRPDANSANYTPYVELRDILDFLSAMDAPRFDVLGSSRGGMNAMLLAIARPGSLGSVILNDLGPVLEPGGVARVMGHIATLKRPHNWDDAAMLVWEMYGPNFPALGEDDWRALAEIWFRETDERRLAYNYDARLAHANRHLDLRRAMPDMWAQYLSLLNHPLMIIRGENSDILSKQTLEQMRTLHWRSKVVTVPGQGHAPMLRDAPSMRTIHAFLSQHDG